MARRSRNVSPNEVTTVIFGSDDQTLRLKIVWRHQPQIMVAVTVNTGTDPDVEYESDDDDTFFIGAEEQQLSFKEASPGPSPWEVRLRTIGGPAVVQLFEDC